MSTAALPRHPSRLAAALNAVAGFGILMSRRIRRSVKVGKDRRTLQTLPDYMLTDLGLEKTEVRTSLGDREVWMTSRRL